MKKVILSIAIIAGVFLMTNINNANASDQPTITISLQDDGFVKVEIEGLNENVQSAIKEIAATYEVTLVQYNSDQKVTKVTGTSKEDKSEKVFLLNDEGKAADSQNEQSSEVEEEAQTPNW